MIMDIQRLQKYSFDNRCLFLLLIMLLSTNTQARGRDSYELGIEDQLLIKDISYDYQLISDNKLGLDCIGSLYFSMSFPTDIKTLIFERTNHHTIGDCFDDLHFTIKSECPITTTNLIIPNIYWGTYFRFCAILKNNNRIYSSTYSINEYINSSDLELLLHQDPSSIKTIDTDTENVYIYTKNKNLEIITQEPIYLTVFDLSGVCIFNREILTAETIPLNDVISPFFIVRYKTSNNTITKKILLQ